MQNEFEPLQYLHFGEQDVTGFFMESSLGLGRMRFPFLKSLVILHRISPSEMKFSDVE